MQGTITYLILSADLEEPFHACHNDLVIALQTPARLLRTLVTVRVPKQQRSRRSAVCAAVLEADDGMRGVREGDEEERAAGVDRERLGGWTRRVHDGCTSIVHEYWLRDTRISPLNG